MLNAIYIMLVLTFLSRSSYAVYFRSNSRSLDSVTISDSPSSSSTMNETFLFNETLVFNETGSVLNETVSNHTALLEELCIRSGGDIQQENCCNNVSPFPSQILIGACGCSPQYSKLVDVCVCPDGMSFDTVFGCVDRELFLNCRESSGTVITQLCCANVDNFPNTCKIGACGCSFEYSIETLVCECPSGKCWDGTRCV